jgi:two-component sensor histidine kinase
MAGETLGSGFLTTHRFLEPDPLSIAFLPLTKETERTAVLLFGSSDTNSFTKKTLNEYLAVAGLVATTITRIDSEKEVQRHRQQLEELVQERTQELQQEIVQRKQREEEKNILMRELNHRVKNNLAIISSLINLKDASLESKVDLSDIRYQIDAIRIIHEKLYKTDKIIHIEMSSYINSLLETIFSSFSHNSITIQKRIEHIHVATKKAVPLGLLINEVATNALKHGFSNEKQAIFTVNMRADTKSNSCYLELSNNGNPFPEDIDLDNPETLGLRLIASLVDQLHGTIDLQRNPHPRFLISFPLQEE